MDLRRKWLPAFLALFISLAGASNLASARICVAETEFAVNNVSGVVLDEYGRAIVSAVVEVQKTKAPTTGRTLTDRDGNFALRGVSSGKYVIRVHAEGFVDAQQPIVVKRSNRASGIEKTLRVVLTLGTGCSSITLIRK